MKGIAKTKYILTIVALSFVLFVSVGVSFAWFAKGEKDINADTLSGELITQYFHCGTGVYGDPFVITSPVHYYNLVNLYQKVDDYSDQHYYFQVGYDQFEDAAESGFWVYDYDNEGRLISDANGNATYSKTLNLSFYSGENGLLPIGTHDKNFLSVFDGKGLTISGLTITCSNTEKTLCDIGIFGYVGSTAIIQNVYFDNVTIDLTGATNDISIVQEPQTHNSSSHTVGANTFAYVGYLAGHVITNSQFTQVYINNATINGGTGSGANSNFSYFGCIQYPDGTLVETLQQSLSSIENANINVGDIYTRLLAYRNSATPQVIELSKKIWVENNSGENIYTVTTTAIRENDTESSKGSFSFADQSSSEQGDILYLTGKGLAQTVTEVRVCQNTDGFYLTSQTGTTYLKLNSNKNGYTTTSVEGEATVWACDNDGRYFTTIVDNVAHTCNYYYITGNGITEDRSVATLWTYDDVNNQLYFDDINDNNTRKYLAFYGESLDGAPGGSPDFIIKSTADNGTVNYLKYDSSKTGNIGNTTTKSEAAKFSQDEDGYWFTTSNNSSTKYYLSLSGNGLILSENGNLKTSWSIVNNQWIYNSKYAISYDYINSAWTAVLITNISGSYVCRGVGGYDFLYIKVEDNYDVTHLHSSDRNDVPSGANIWTLPSATNTKFYTNIYGVDYYLVGNSGGTVTATTDINLASDWTKSGGYYKIKINGIDYFLNKLSADADWTLTTNQRDGASLLSSAGSISGVAGNGESEELSPEPGTIHKDPNHIYYTVTIDEETTYNSPIDTWFPLLVNNDGTPLDDNFGYVISGLDYKTENIYQSGDIRVSNNIGVVSFFSSGTLNNVYTKNGSGANEAQSQSFTAYDSAKSSFEALLSGKSQYSGLQFMKSQVEMNDYVQLSSATLYGQNYTDYQLPRHCIDLHVNTVGSINLFAYASDSNTEFFSLFHIIRNEDNEITEIKKILKIYKSISGYNYFYGGEDTNDPNNLVFDESWMSVSGRSGLFYFEIPVNVGEYALGSYNGDNSNVGANLLYLDITTPKVDLKENGLTNNNFNVDYRSTGYVGSPNYVDYSLLQFSINAPNNSEDDFSVSVSFSTESLLDEYSKGLYTITVTNKTDSDIDLTVFLCDDDNTSYNEYLYAYKVVYCNKASNQQTTVLNGDKDYFKSCEVFTIPRLPT